MKCPCLHSDIFVICNSASVANTALIRAQRKREKKSSCFEIKQLVHLLPIPMSTSTTNYCRDTNTLDLLGDMYKYHFKLGAAGETMGLRCVCRVCGASYLGQVFENSVVLVVAAVFLPTSSSETKESKL